MQSFAELGVSRAVIDSLAKGGITEPFAVQRLVIADILAGRDVLARSPTGSGKTLAFGVPLVDGIPADGPRPAALILAPTRELATQIASDLRPIAHARALRITAVYGGVGLVDQAKRAANSHILVATPGRLEDLLARRAFNLDNVTTLVLDEADRMLDMGFKPAVDRIVRACPTERQTLFFSATLDGDAGRTARSYTHDPVTHEHGPTNRRAVEDVQHRFVALKGADRVETLISELKADRELALVFVRTKRGADRLVKRLGARGVSAVSIHGNKSQRQRERALATFASGSTDTLVATDVAARGIDITGISHVINFDPPHDHESYVHRVGRTGRAGRSGLAITLVDSAERGDVSKLADRLGLDHGLQGGFTPRPPAQRSRPRPAGRPSAPRHGQATNRPDGPRSRTDGPRSRRRRSGRPRAAASQS
jgi:ATP-dependent RNA helicase RhlE